MTCRTSGHEICRRGSLVNDTSFIGVGCRTMARIGEAGVSSALALEPRSSFELGVFFVFTYPSSFTYPMNPADDSEYQTWCCHPGVVDPNVACVDPARRSGDCGVGHGTPCVTAGCADCFFYGRLRYNGVDCRPLSVVSLCTCCRAVKSCKKSCDGRRGREPSAW
jgi:hypothetical protein